MSRVNPDGAKLRRVVLLSKQIGCSTGSSGNREQYSASGPDEVDAFDRGDNDLGSVLAELDDWGTAKRRSHGLECAWCNQGESPEAPSENVGFPEDFFRVVERVLKGANEGVSTVREDREA